MWWSLGVGVVAAVTDGAGSTYDKVVNSVNTNSLVCVIWRRGFIVSSTYAYRLRT